MQLGSTGRNGDVQTQLSCGQQGCMTSCFLLLSCHVPVVLRTVSYTPAALENQTSIASNMLATAVALSALPKSLIQGIQVQSVCLGEMFSQKSLVSCHNEQKR